MKVISSIRIVIYLLVLLVACSPQPTGETDLQKKDATVQGYVIPEDSLPRPKIIPAGKPRQVRIGQQLETPDKQLIHLALAPRKVNLLSPVHCTPGENGFNIPKPIKSIENPFFCKTPEVVLAKDAYSKDINPQNFISFSKLQGLRHDQVRSMIQDKMGNLWLGTDDGVTKYDGKYFSHYSTDQGLTNNMILSVFQDKKDNLWFGTFRGGVVRYDGRYLTSFTTAEGMPSNIVNCITEDQAGNLWFGTGEGAVKYDGEYLTVFSTNEGLCHNDVRSILQDDSGNMWISTNGGGISIFDGKTFSNFSEKEGLVQNYISTLFKDKTGNIWLGTVSRGIVKYDGSVFISYTETEGLNNNSIRTILQDDQGNMWFGCYQGGISKFDGKYFTHYTESEGLTVNIIRSSLKDQDGNLWFGTRGGGITRFDGGLFTHLTSFQGLSNKGTMSVLQDKSDNLWVGTFGDYVTRYSSRSVNGVKQRYFTRFGEKEGLLNSRIYSIIQDNNGNIWFGTDGGGVSKFDGKMMTTYAFMEGLPSNTIRKIYQDREGNFWFATYGSGVSRFDGKNFTNYSVKEGLSSNNVLSILQDTKGNIWFGTDGGGLTCFDGKNFIHYTPKQGFITNTVYSILQDKNGIIWFGTEGNGVLRYDGNSFVSYSESEGLSNSHVLSMIQDSKGNLWFGTRFGPNVLKAEYSDQIRNKTRTPLFENYGHEDGFLGISCNLGAMCEDQEGTIWIGSNDRLTAFHPGKGKKHTSPPNLQLTNIQLFNEDIPWAGLAEKKDTTFTLHNGVSIGNFSFTGISKWYSLPENLSLSYEHNYITFNFIGISQKQAKKIRYQYKLEGLDDNWCASTSRTEAAYGNLVHGHYQFKVKAMNSEGSWSNEVNYPFTIRAPWWRTWWCYLSTFTAIILLIFSFIKYREKKLKQDKLVLQKKVNEQTRKLTLMNVELIEQKNEILEKNSSIEKKNKELQLTNYEKDKFFSIIAHDVRGPLSSFLSLTELMAEELPEMKIEDLQEIISSMSDSARNLFDLLENLLEWSRMERGMTILNPGKLNLAEFSKKSISILSELAKNKSIALSIDIPDGLNVYADKNMLATILRNLVSNAIKFTPQGGKTSLQAKLNQNQEIEISVTDTGIGMSAEIMENIFLLNGKTSRPGTDGESSTGLGLLLCKEFVEKNKGQIWVESEVGKGSTFHFTLKRA